MTSKERVKTAMDLGQPDRVPLMCQFSIGHMLQQLEVSPSEFWYDPKVFADGLIKLREIYDFDGILVSLHGHNPNWQDEKERTEHVDQQEVVYWKNGDKTFFPPDDLPSKELLYTYEKHSLENIRDDILPQKLNYIPVSQDLHFLIHEDHKFDAIEDVVNRAGSEYSVHGEVTSPFDYFLDYAGYQEALMGLIDYPENCKKVLNHFSELISELASEMAETGVDAIKISSPFAGSGFISPNDYKEYVVPYERKIAEAIRAKGVHAYLHTCGQIDDRLETMFETGISGIECLDPPPLGNVELESAKQRIGNKGFIKGNIDSVNLLLFGSDEEILKDAEWRLKVGKQDGGFILSTACSIAPMVHREKIQLLKQAVDKWG